MKKQEKKLTPTEKKTPEALSDEEISSVAGGTTVIILNLSSFLDK